MIKINRNIRDYSFLEYKKLLCTAYQTSDFKIAFTLGKEDYLQEFDDYLPYPIDEHLEEYELFCRFLEVKIENENLLDMVLISKSEIKAKYKLNDKFFDLFYPEPEQKVKLINSKERFGKVMYSSLFNENKVIQILESEQYQIYLENKKTRKTKYFN